MRCLARDTQKIFISLYESREEVKDKQGRYTGDIAVVRSEPISLVCNVGAAVGSSQIEVFGQLLDYDKTVLIDNTDFEISETAVLWIENSTDEPYDYIIKRIARTPNFTALAVSRVDISNG